MNGEVRDAVDTIWEYMLVHHEAGAADCLIVLGSRDDRVASYAAQLTGQFRYDTIIISGGTAHHNDLLATKWQEATEAEHFLGVMRRAGVVGDVLLEDKATNTGENAVYSGRLLVEQGKPPGSVLVVTKPYMERRAKATFEAQWPFPRTRIHVTSPGLGFDDYVNHEQPAETVVNIMVGDLQRIMEYPRHGLQSEQAIPAAVERAYAVLIRHGYTRHLVEPM